MSLGRILGLCAVPLGLFAVAVGIVLTVGPSAVGGAMFAVVGGAPVLAGIWMLVAGRPRSLPFSAAALGSKSSLRSLFPLT